MSYLILDLLVLLVIALFVWRGAAKGFILSFCGLVAILVAFIGAGFAANTLSPAVARAIEPRLASAIEAQLEEQLHQAGQTAGGAAAEIELPMGDVLNALREMVFYEELVDTVDRAVENGMAAVAADAAARVAASIAQAIAYRIIFALSFLLILAAWGALSHALDLVARLPGLHFLNKTAGAAIGFVKAILVLFLAAWLMELMGVIIPEETVRQTHLLQFFLYTSPMELLRTGAFPA